MADDHADHHEESRRDYDPEHVRLPERAPPLRSTAPQSDFTASQVLTGVGIALLGLVLTFGIAFTLA